MLSLLTTILITQGVFALPPATYRNAANQAPLSPSNIKSENNDAATPKHSIPPIDTIICPTSEAILPIYGPPSQHHSYVTAVNTFCRRDLPHIPHGAPNTHSAAPPGDSISADSYSSHLSSSVPIAPGSPLSRSYRVTLIAEPSLPQEDSRHSRSRTARADASTIRKGRPGPEKNNKSKAAKPKQQLPPIPNSKTHLPDAHQLSLEILTNGPHAVLVSSEDCVASFMAIVDAASGCRVSDALTKTGEYRVGRSNERGMEGLVYRATQWK